MRFPRRTTPGSSRRLGGHSVLAKTRASEALRWAQWGSVVLGGLTAAVIISGYRHQHAVVLDQARTNLRLRLASARRRAVEYFDWIYSDLRFISLDDHVQAMTSESRGFIQAIYDEHYGRHRLAEVYVIERDFDGTRQPFMVFEHGDGEHDVDEVHSLEREAEEYQTQVRMIQQFAENPSLEALVSSPVKLCVDKQGVVLAVPIRSGGELMGIVAGMIPSENIANVIQPRDSSELVVLVNGRGDPFAPSSVPERTKDWLAGEFRKHGVAGVFTRSGGLFDVDEYSVLAAETRLVGDEHWYLALLSDHYPLLRRYGLLGPGAGYGVGALTLFLGLSLALLFRNLRRRLRVEHALRVAHEEMELRVRDRTADLAAANSRLHQENTERKRVEQALRKSEERHRAVTESAQDAIITSDAEGNILFWNPAAEKIFGFSAGEAVGKNMMDLIVPPQYHEIKSKGLAEFARTGKGNAIGKTLERTALRKDGTEFPVELSTSAYQEREHFLGVALVRDLTERKKMEQQLQHSQKIQAIGSLTAGIAHDYKNQLQAVLASLEMAMADLQPVGRAYRAVAVADRAAMRSLEITRGLLTFSRNQPQSCSPLDLGGVLDETHQLLRRTLPAHIRVEVVRPADLRPVFGDAAQVEQVLMNLAINARDAMPSGGTLSITARNEDTDASADPSRPAHVVVISVRDTGCGMDAETVSRIFDPFFTTKQRGQGTGLGLSTAHGIIRSHGGWIEVSSTPGRGTTFEIFLPASTPGDDEGQPHQRPALESVSGASRSPREPEGSRIWEESNHGHNPVG